MHSSILDGGMTQVRYSNFLIELAELLAFEEDPFVILCDNAPSHSNAPSIGEQGQLRYLPKYSPFLNACEMAGSSLKAALKRRLSEPGIQLEIYNRHDHRTETLQSRRVRVLHRELEHCLQVLTPRKCSQWVNHTLTYMPSCLRETDIYS